MSHLKPVDVSSFNLEIEGVKMDTVFIPDGYIPAHFMPLVETHHVMTGDMLKNGMVVAIAEAIGRENPDRHEPEYRVRNPQWLGPSSSDREHLARTSRWAIVHNVKFDNGIVSFDGLYADGTIIPRSYAFQWKWVVIKEVPCNPTDVRQAYEKTQDEFFERMLPYIHGAPFDPSVIGQLITNTEGITVEEPSAPPVNPKNFKRRLRDASSLKQVADILKEYNQHFAEKREQKLIEEAESQESARNSLQVAAESIRVNDAIEFAGGKYYVDHVTQTRGRGRYGAVSHEIIIEAVGTNFPHNNRIKITLSPMDLVQKLPNVDS